MLDTVRAVFSKFYTLYFRLMAHLELGKERAERQMFSLGPSRDQVIFSRKWTRSGLYVHNEGPGVAYIGFGSDQTTDESFTIKLPIDTSFEMHGHGRVFQGEIRATADTGSTLVMFTETRRVVSLAPSPQEVLAVDMNIHWGEEASGGSQPQLQSRNGPNGR